MQEFSDFLRHRCAYVATAKFKPGKFPEAQKLFEKAVATYKTGFKGAYLFQKPNTDEGIAFIIWDKIDDMEDNRNPVHDQILEEMKHLFAAPPETNFYEVLTEITVPS
ncbi:MAG: antibiotic biosynthesis monooxygenase [Geminocystis sp.]|nr:antibiotic biosynthesis monooxygenase [Geminocystis sp.]HIK36677.1 antibiotic biosynthesis monooxygenase [Geminocystis sp. M7585_C2015_104]MCS7148481.1 antibiotic biosynthesis monooxygenase [Geminocystis sp.]MCX8079437.1 antibiotic biosynthesis monooxygenase [Geminocystis sp.]MDW8114945.1 antibiotic biosynthesis monooxygenase [Geminocystis sp.]